MPEHFVEPAMHGIWLVLDTTAFGLNPGPTSERDHPLTFGLTYKEWFALFFDVLRVNQDGFKRWAEKNPSEARGSIISDFDEEIPDYPMLSRIRGYHYDAVFEADELERLRQECLKVKGGTSNEIALRGLDKLLRICDYAQELSLSIYFMAD
jgi:hypothetical protein